MKKLNRIKENQEFALTIKKGHHHSNSAYLVSKLDNQLGYTRVGIAVPTKIGHAVLRVRTRRQIRAMCDSLINYTSHTFDIVIIVKNDFLNNTFDKNYELLESLLSDWIR